MMGQAVEQRGGHLGVAKNTRPFAECEIGRHDHRGLLVEAADQVEQQLSASLRERQIAEFVEDDEVLAIEIVGQASLASGAALGLKPVDQINDIEEPAAAPSRMQARAMAMARCDLPVPVEPGAYCPISQRRWADLLSVSPSPRSDRGDPEAAAFRRDGGVCCSPAGRDVNACAVLDDAGSGRTARCLSRAAAGAAEFARSAHRDRCAPSLSPIRLEQRERAGRCAP